MSIPFSWFRYGQCSKAFSLLELIITIVIFGILVSLALPAFHLFVKHEHFLMVEARLLQALDATKAMAVAQNAALALCGSHDGRECDGDWNANWLIVSEANREVLQVFQSDCQQVDIQWTGNFHARDGVLFTGLGETAGQQGHFSLTLNPYHANIILIETGRLRVN